MSAYLLMYLSVPILNTLVNHLDKKIFQTIIIVSVIIFAILPTITQNILFENQFIWFVILYLIGAYLREYGLKDISTKFCISLIILSSMISIMSFTILDLISKKVVILSGKEMVFLNTQGILPLITAVLIFVLTSRIDIPINRFINLISSTVFAIYLIHEHPLVRKLYWGKIYSFIDVKSPVSIILTGIISSIIIFILAVIFDLCRKEMLSKIKKYRNCVSGK